jgi:hypothetical protein
MATGPFIFIATNRLKPGRLAAERERVPGLSDFIEANEPRILAFNEYANDDGTEVGVVQVHPDVDSFSYHMDVVRERATRAYAETLEGTTSIHVFGTPTEAILEMLRNSAGSAVGFTVKPHHLGGFTRLDRA